MRPRAAVIAAAAIALIAPVRAPAFDQPGCGGSWKPAGASCGFYLGGTPLTIYADSQVTSGAATLKAWVTVDGYDQADVMDCTLRATGDPKFATCDNEYSARQLDNNFPGGAPTLRLICHVQGNGVGTYYCSSGHRP
jgi:hypothetical protein